jgi:hypothetical protein
MAIFGARHPLMHDEEVRDGSERQVLNSNGQHGVTMCDFANIKFNKCKPNRSSCHCIEIVEIVFQAR